MWLIEFVQVAAHLVNCFSKVLTRHACLSVSLSVRPFICLSHCAVQFYWQQLKSILHNFIVFQRLFLPALPVHALGVRLL